MILVLAKFLPVSLIHAVEIARFANICATLQQETDRLSFAAQVGTAVIL